MAMLFDLAGRQAIWHIVPKKDGKIMSQCTMFHKTNPFVALPLHGSVCASAGIYIQRSTAEDRGHENTKCVLYERTHLGR